MNSRLIPWLLRCFPSAWRAEYEAEFEYLLSKKPLRLPDVLDVLKSALKERARLPIARLGLGFAIAGLSLFMIGLGIAAPAWRVLSYPALALFRSHGMQPPALVATTPYEAFAVMYLGFPLLFSTFLLYPALITFGSMFVNRQKDPRTQRRAKSMAWYSGSVFVVSLMLGILLWRQGSPLELLFQLQFANPSHAFISMVSVGAFFLLFVEFAVVWAVAWQIPVFLLFARRGKTQAAEPARQ